MTNDLIYEPPFTHTHVYVESGCGSRSVSTMNVYDNLGRIVCRAGTYDTAMEIAAALNVFYAHRDAERRKLDLETLAGPRPE